MSKLKDDMAGVPPPPKTSAALDFLKKTNNLLANQIPNHISLPTTAKLNGDLHRFASILDGLMPDAYFYDHSDVPDECIICDNNSTQQNTAAFVDHLGPLTKSQQNLISSNTDTSNPFWLLGNEKETAVIKLDSKHPYTVGCLEMKRPNSVVAAPTFNSTVNLPKHVPGFLDVGREMLKNQQLATNLTYSLCKEAMSRFTKQFTNNASIFDETANGTLATTLIELLLSCLDIINKTTAFINNTQSNIDNVKVSQEKSSCSTCRSMTHCNVFDLGVLVSLNTLKGQKETANSIKKATELTSDSTAKKQQQQPLQQNSSEQHVTPRPLLDSVNMGMWFQPDQNHNRNSLSKNLVFTCATKDAQCYVRKALSHLTEEEKKINKKQQKHQQQKQQQHHHHHHQQQQQQQQAEPNILELLTVDDTGPYIQASSSSSQQPLLTLALDDDDNDDNNIFNFGDDFVVDNQVNRRKSVVYNTEKENNAQNLLDDSIQQSFNNTFLGET